MAPPLEQCRLYEGAEDGFWPLFTEALASATGAAHILLLRRTIEPLQSWQAFATWPGRERFPLGVPLDDPAFAAALEAAVREEIAEFRPPAEPKVRLPAVLLDAGLPGYQCVAIFRFMGAAPGPEDFNRRVARTLDLPLLYRRAHALRLARADNNAFAQTLDLLALLDKQVRFVPAAMTVCNELARKGRCSRVSLGWRHDAYVRLTAISDMPRFERGMDAIQKLESAMEEAFDQDEEIILPEPDDASYVARDHQIFAQSQGVANVATLPLRLDERSVGVVTLERGDRAFSSDEVTALRVVLDRATRRLDELERQDGSAWRRGVRGTRNHLARLLGPEHTWWKALGIGIAGLLLAAFLCTWPYRVEGSFVVRSHTLLNLPAPFDGFLAEVPVKVGDKVTAGSILVRLDKRDLLLEQNSLQAEIARYEAERAQAEVERRLADMRSAAAAKEQSQANLEINRFHLTRADITAPAPGVIIEGDLRERIGAPVRAGDILMRMTRIDEMYVEIEVPERDAYAILAAHGAEIAFATLPDQRYPVEIERFEPTARVKNDGNVFVLRARFKPAGIDPWWRPGMSGVAKLAAGRRPIIWLLTHRLVDFVRLKLWL
jgi:biotin carboxyl carrier protein